MVSILRSLMAQAFRIPEKSVFEKSAMQNTPGWDSLSHMNLIFNIENRFKIRLTADEIAKMQSLQKIEKIINTKIKKKYNEN